MLCLAAFMALVDQAILPAASPDEYSAILAGYALNFFNDVGFDADQSRLGRITVIAGQVTIAAIGRTNGSITVEMRMHNLTRLAVVASFASLAQPAAAFQAVNGFTVTQTGPQEFTVDYEVVQNETAYWCAAGDFAVRALDLPRKTRLYRTSPVPRRAGQGITFTLDPAAAASESGLSNFSGNGDGSVSIGHARGSFCSLFIKLPFE